MQLRGTCSASRCWVLPVSTIQHCGNCYQQMPLGAFCDPPCGLCIGVSGGSVVSATVVTASVVGASVADNTMHLVMLMAVHMPCKAVNSSALV